MKKFVKSVPLLLILVFTLSLIYSDSLEKSYYKRFSLAKSYYLAPNSGFKLAPTAEKESPTTTPADENTPTYYLAKRYRQLGHPELGDLPFQWDEFFKTNPDSQKLIEAAIQGVFRPTVRRTPEDVITRHLLSRNAEKIIGIDPERAFQVLSTWDESDNLVDAMTFLGLRLTGRCNFNCPYCDQPKYAEKMDMDNWKEVISQATRGGLNQGLYISMSGGEPLLLKDKLYGPEGLIRHAADQNAVVNVNTNASTITPEVALKIVASGVAKLHISLDSPHKEVVLTMTGTKKAFKLTMQGIFNIHFARALCGVDYPVTHINVVATKHNLKNFTELFAFLLALRTPWDDLKASGNTHTNPNLRDLSPHLIPVGGQHNAALRPSKADWLHFYLTQMPELDRMWLEYQDSLSIANKSSFQDVAFYVNQYRRVTQRIGFETFLSNFEQGNYADGALEENCYALPTQMYILPDGTTYPCSAHADHALGSPSGNFLERKSVPGLLRDTLRKHQWQFGRRNPACSRCLGSTLHINQKVRQRLQEAAFRKAA